MTSITYGSSDTVAALKGAIVNAYPPSDRPNAEVATSQSIDEFARFTEPADEIVTVPTQEAAEQNGAS